MRHPLILCFALVVLAVPGAGSQTPPGVNAPPVLYFPNANSRPTYFSIHNIHTAWEFSRGEGVRVGILDHSFGFQVHDGLYAGGKNFQEGEWGEAFDSVSHHGFWMARTLREVAPEVEIYALGTYSSDEGQKVDAMIRAIEWATENELDVLTYSARRFSPDVRGRLDEAVDRAHAKGLITTFIHYPHPQNLLPTWLGPRSGDDEREPDFNILHYDYSVVFTKQYAEWMEEGPESGYRPFLSISSTSPVLAGFVAILKSMSRDLDPGQVRRILRETSRAIEFEGHGSPRTIDIGAAARNLVTEDGRRPEKGGSPRGESYLGQTTPGLEPELFAHGTVSTEQNEVNSVFSPDGREFYFSRFRPGHGYVMMAFHEIGGRWMGPEILPFSGKFSDVDMSFSTDGQRMNFISKRPLDPGGARPEGYQIWSAQRTLSGWEEPLLLNDHVNMGPRQLYPTEAENGTLYFNSASSGHGRGDFFRTTRGEAGHEEAENLGPSINSEFDETDAFIARDESFIIFTSVDRPDGFGDGDLYISFKDPDGRWAPAVNMGSTVNTPSSEFSPMMSPDGRHLFFTSRRRGNDDIYWVDASILDQFHPFEGGGS